MLRDLKYSFLPHRYSWAKPTAMSDELINELKKLQADVSRTNLQLGEQQVRLTKLLERMDRHNARIGCLEKNSLLQILAGGTSPDSSPAQTEEFEVEKLEETEEDEEEEGADKEKGCWGCSEDQPNQLAHMEPGGCLYQEEVPEEKEPPAAAPSPRLQTFAVKGMKPTLKEAQDFVGGWVQQYFLGGGEQLLVDEEALLKKKPLNRDASALALFPVYGDCILLLGDARWMDDDGEEEEKDEDPHPSINEVEEDLNFGQGEENKPQLTPTLKAVLTNVFEQEEEEPAPKRTRTD